MSIKEKACRFAQLHCKGEAFIMANAWNPGTAVLLEDAGVARISIGGSLARATLGLVRKAAKEMLEHGTFHYSTQQIADAGLCKLFSKRE